VFCPSHPLLYPNSWNQISPHWHTNKGNLNFSTNTSDILYGINVWEPQHLPDLKTASTTLSVKNSYQFCGFNLQTPTWVQFRSQELKMSVWVFHNHKMLSTIRGIPYIACLSLLKCRMPFYFVPPYNYMPKHLVQCFVIIKFIFLMLLVHQQEWKHVLLTGINFWNAFFAILDTFLALMPIYCWNMKLTAEFYSNSDRDQNAQCLIGKLFPLQRVGNC